MPEEPEIIFYDNLTRPKRDVAPVNKPEKRVPTEEPELIWYDNLTRSNSEGQPQASPKQRAETATPVELAQG